jgi:hypothetical protein
MEVLSSDWSQSQEVGINDVEISGYLLLSCQKSCTAQLALHAGETSSGVEKCRVLNF